VDVRAQVPAEEGTAACGRGGVPRGARPARHSLPMGKLKAFYKDRNFWLSDGRCAKTKFNHKGRQTKKNRINNRHGQLGLR